ncbi:MAG: TatD family hydrolase [Deltaproteobacteria bacterium]|nr:TatD family hydrolase [Deltaproteobacteria bacterium]
MSTNIPAIDGHAHLSELKDLKRQIAEARRVGVRAIIGVGMDIKSNRQTLKIAEAYPGFVLPAVGYHPWEIREGEIEETLAFVEANIDRCVAIGEVGIDYKVKVGKALQREVFRRIVELSVRYDKALILHCRYSHQRVFGLIREAGVRRAVFHWYSGPLDLVREIVSAGYFVSATPSLRRSPPHREGIRQAPLERILVETDCPVIHGDRESRSSDVITTVEEVARIKGIPTGEAADVIFQNTLDFYELPRINP